MRSKIRLAIVVVGLVLAHGLEARATQQADFLNTMRRFGITDSVFTSKKPCLCSGGTQDGQIGRLVAGQSVSGGRVLFDCVLLSFDPDGNEAGSAGCIANGGSISVVPK
jgi:hypothetical protein